MEIYREPIYHDRQVMDSIVSQDTTLINTFEDITDATLTTKDLGQTGNYDIQFFPLISASSSNTTVTFRSLVNGIQNGDDRVVFVKTSGLDLSFPIVGFLTGVDVGDVIQIQISTDKGVVTISEFELKIDGIPEIRVIE